MNINVQLDNTFSALAHPVRRRILSLLAHGDRRVTDVASDFDCSLNVVSQHIKVMENAGLVHREQRGRVHQICLETKPLRAAAEFIERYRQQWERKLDNLTSYLDQMASDESNATAHKTKNNRK
jgi:DNA-binding transcriptional ArsR family regulator